MNNVAKVEKVRYKTVKIEEANYERLMRVKGFLEQKFAQHFTLNDVIETLLDVYDEHGGEYFATPMEELGYYYVDGARRRTGRRGDKTRRD